MNDLKTLREMNDRINTAKYQAWARALNAGGKGHAKDAEKGRAKLMGPRRKSVS